MEENKNNLQPPDDIGVLFEKFGSHSQDHNHIRDHIQTQCL